MNIVTRKILFFLADRRLHRRGNGLAEHPVWSRVYEAACVLKSESRISYCNGFGEPVRPYWFLHMEPDVSCDRIRCPYTKRWRAYTWHIALRGFLAWNCLRIGCVSHHTELPGWLLRLRQAFELRNDDE